MQKQYPLHPGQTHASPLYTQLPLEEYEALMKENKALKQANKNLTESVAELDAMRLKEVELDMRERELKEERRWRKCSDEMPSADEGYFIVLWEDKFPDIGYIGAEDNVIETIRDRGEGHSVEWWMPMPPAPKEASK